MEVFNNINEVKVTEKVLGKIQLLIEEYLEYIESLKTLDDKNLARFLELLKNREVVNNQQAEGEDSFLINFHRADFKKTGLDLAISLEKRKIKYNLDNIEIIHKQAILGTCDDLEENYFYRTKEVRVSAVDHGKEVLMYVPPVPSDISKHMIEIIKELNNKKEFDVKGILNTFKTHALIAILQPFGNGNTRLSRIIQHVELFKLTNSVDDYKFTNPILYLSESYLMYRKVYRENIAKVAQENTQEAWDKWFVFNVNMMNEQIYRNKMLIQKIKGRQY